MSIKLPDRYLSGIFYRIGYFSGPMTYVKIVKSDGIFWCKFDKNMIKYIKMH